MPSRLKASQIASRTALLTLVAPATGSLIQNRSEKSSDFEPKPMKWQTGAGVASTRGTAVAASIATRRTMCGSAITSTPNSTLSRTSSLV